MTNLSREICYKIRDARRLAGLSQVALSLEMGCKQSALSAFENGDGTKLNDAVIAKLGKRFGIEIREEKAVASMEEVAPSVPFIAALVPHTGFCPNPNCPAHTRYEVEGRVFLKPGREMQDPAGGKYCAICGEILERTCPRCGAPVHEGAVCSFCGQPYVAV